MALQHFYSRIPSRVSMFNKADSFDTFACSDGLSPEFIERELFRVYDNRPGLNEADLIRKGELPPAYCQITAKSGELIQSCISFIAKDYTGERSSHLVHSFVFAGEEKNELLHGDNVRIVDKTAFMHDYEKFDVTAALSPVYDYPTKTDFAKEEYDAGKILERYEAHMLKRLIFAILSLACGKGKNVFIILPEELSLMSERALDVMESMLQILPYNLRDAISFVTYTGDWNKYSAFKIRFIAKGCGQIPAAKGWTLDFGATSGNENLDREVAKELGVVEFFYSLLGNAEVRREFLLFTENACQSGSINNFSLKTLSDLVFLFKSSSGLFDDKTVVPNDDLLFELLCVYEKYKNALEIENRMEIAKKFRRYPERHAVIPKNLFAKMSKLYHGEPEAVKRVYMNVALDLIHTDIMREKLFAFIKNNYSGESEDMRVKINGDLCRVFYGGFLQPQILAFFAENYRYEPIATQDIVLDKILLVIRTKAIQDGILEFIKNNYDCFSYEQKGRLFDTVFEMFAFGDQLSRLLADVMDGVMSGEDEQVKLDFTRRLCLIVESEQKKHEHPFFEILLGSDGFCVNAVIGNIFEQWSARKIFGEFVDFIARSDWKKRSRIAYLACKNLPCADPAVTDKFMKELSAAYAKTPVKGGVFTIIDSEQEMLSALVDDGDEEAQKCGEKYSEVVSLFVENSLYDLFKNKARSDGTAVIQNYAAKHPSLASSEKYAVVSDCILLTDCIKSANYENAIAVLERLPCGDATGKAMAEYVEYVNGSAADEYIVAATAIIVYKLGEGKYAFADAYGKLLRKIIEKSDARNPERAEKAATEQALPFVLSIAAPAAEFDGEILSDRCDLRKLIVDCFTKLSKKDRLALEEKEVKIFGNKPIGKFVSECATQAKNSDVGFFAKLFGKK